MADLLSRLAARTLGQGEDVRPLVAPLFASDRPPDAPEVIASLPEPEPDAAWDGPASEPPSPAPTRLRPPAAPARRSTVASDVESESEQATHAAPRPILARPPGRQPTVTPASPEPPQPTFASVQARPSPRLISPGDTTGRRPAPLVPRSSHADAAVVAQAEPPWVGLPDQMPPANAPLVSDRAEAPRTLPQPAAPDTPRPLVEIATPPQRVATGTPFQPEPDGDRRQSASEAKEPAVHVTIGRIDVRAVLPDPPPLPVARPEPRLTIEEYSRQRREGLR
jgi:hypothetical protein